MRKTKISRRKNSKGHTFSSRRKQKTATPTHRLLRFIARLIFWGLLFFILVSAAEVATVRFIDPPVTMIVAVQHIGASATGKGYRPPKIMWRRLNQIAPSLRRAVLAAEDQRFLAHNGFDITEIRQTLEGWLKKGRLRGASTISMQTARTLFLWPDRTVLRKGLEAWYTIFLELFLTKKRIFELYMNTVDWGGGIMGAEAAARRYYKVPANRLTDHQSAALAAILPNPHIFSPKTPNRFILDRRQRILSEMKKMPLIK